MHDLGEKFLKTKKLNPAKKRALNFITAGIGCNCLVTLFETGILDILLNKLYLSDLEINKNKHSACIKSALLTLEKCQVVKLYSKKYFKITKFGRALSEYLGLITMLFDGYGDLMAKQSKIVNKKIRNPEKLINGPSVSKSAVLLSQNLIDPILLNEIKNVNFAGTICDLGCGYARMLTKACEVTGNSGLGFDSEYIVIEQIKKKLGDKQSSISVELGDISNLIGTWDHVDVLMQCHVFHDFNPMENAVNILRSYLSNFPNLKYFFFIDTVSPSEKNNNILPGFDYIHGLQGMLMRTYDETLILFNLSNYEIFKEIPIPDMPNTFMWILIPKHNYKGALN